MERIALFIPELDGGGAQRVFLCLAREFASMGMDVDLVVAQARGELLPEVPDEVSLVDLGGQTGWLGRAGFGFCTVVRLTAYLKRRRPSVLLCTITGANLVAVAARAMAGSDVRLILREAITLRNRPNRRWLRLTKLMYRFADGVIVLSSVMQQEMESLAGLPKGKIVCIPNPVDLRMLESRSQVPFDPGIESFVLAVGRMTDQKDYGTLIRSFAILNRAEMHLVILGDGPERLALELLVVQLGLQGRIHLPGFDANPWRWMKRARIFVLSSLAEGEPNALIEAMALGLPVVSTEYDESVHALVGRSGRVVPTGRPEQMAQAMGEVLDSPPPAATRRFPTPADVASRYLSVMQPLGAGHA